MRENDVGVADQIRRKLTQALSPDRLEVVDESARHKGHAGARPEGETHFRVTVVSAAFEGKSRIERHMLVNEALAEELRGPVHMLSIKALTPAEEWQ